MGEAISYTKEGIDALIAAGIAGAVDQADIDAAVAALVNAAPTALNQLNELAAAMGNDPNFATTMINNLAALKSGAMGVVVHGAVAATARPAGFGAIHWIGSVAPTNAVDNDVWTDTSA